MPPFENGNFDIVATFNGEEIGRISTEEVTTTISNAGEATATFRFENLDGQEQEVEIGPIERIDMSTSSSNHTLDDNLSNFSRRATGSLFLPPQSASEFFNLQDPELTTVSTNTGTATVGRINSRVPWDDIISTPYSLDRIATTRSSNDRITDLMEDYIRNRNQDDKLFINHNTCQREIEYNSIDDVIEFREYLDNIIKQHYQRR